MEVQPVQSSGATLTEALTAAEQQLSSRPMPETESDVSQAERTGSGFFARLFARLRAKPAWREHPWQVGVNRRGQKVTATRWARKQATFMAEDLSPSRAERGKPVLSETAPAPRTETVDLPSPKKSQPAESAQPAPDEQHSFGYGLDEILPPELLKESPLLQRDPDIQKESSPEQVSRLTGQTPPRFVTLLAARVYDETALLHSARRSYDGLV